MEIDKSSNRPANPAPLGLVIFHLQDVFPSLPDTVKKLHHKSFWHTKTYCTVYFRHLYIRTVNLCEQKTPFHHLQNTWSEIRTCEDVSPSKSPFLLGWLDDTFLLRISYDMSDSEETLEMRSSHPSPPNVPVSAWMFLSCFFQHLPNRNVRTRNICKCIWHIYVYTPLNVSLYFAQQHVQHDSMRFRSQLKFIQDPGVVHDTTEIKDKIYHPALQDVSSSSVNHLQISRASRTNLQTTGTKLCTHSLERLLVKTYL